MEKKLIRTKKFSPEEIVKIILNSGGLEKHQVIEDSLPETPIIIGRECSFDFLLSLNLEEIPNSQHKETGLTIQTKYGEKISEFRIGLPTYIIKKLKEQSIPNMRILVHKYRDGSLVNLTDEELDQIDTFIARVYSCFSHVLGEEKRVQNGVPQALQA